MIRILKKEDIVGLKHVTSDKILVNGNFNNEGLFSEEIFGNEKIPSCKCGALRGVFYLGEECPVSTCGTKVSEQYGRYAATISLGEYKVLQPIIVTFCKQQGVDLKEVFNPQKKIVSLDGEYEYSENEFISILDLTRDVDAFITKLQVVKPDISPDFIQFLSNNKEDIVTSELYVLPISLREVQLSKASNKMAIHSDPINSYYMQLINIANNIKEFSEEIVDDEVLENELYQIQVVADELSNYIIEDIFSGKEGIFRSDILSNRINFSARAPITLLDDAEYPESVHIPRDMFVEMYKLKLVGMISRKENIIYSDAERYIMMNRFDENNEIINESISQLINEGDLTVLINRNPSLTHNNLLYAKVTKVHKESVIKISKMFLKSIDGDIDGDTVALFTLDTKEAKEAAKRLYSLRTLVKSPYNNGELSANFLALYQDNKLGMWLLKKENFEHLSHS